MDWVVEGLFVIENYHFLLSSVVPVIEGRVIQQGQCQKVLVVVQGIGVVHRDLKGFFLGRGGWVEKRKVIGVVVD